jgi:hypothetical protein
MGSWKTTVAAVAGFVALVAGQTVAQFDQDPATVADWGAVLAALPVLIGLFYARDHDVSSEAAGIKESE